MFYVLRHGETEWNRLGLLQGRKDSPLTALGETQAAAMGRTVARLARDPAGLSLWSSPLGRARHTARIVAEALGRDGDTIAFDDRLVELDYGTWEGASITEIARGDRASYERRYADKFRNPVPQGESYGDGWRRIASWIAERERDRETVVVGHGALNRMLIAALAGLDPQGFLDLPTPHDVLYVVDGASWRPVETVPAEAEPAT